MKISIASDLHLEFQSLNLVNDSKSEVLVLAGDVVSFLGENFDQYQEFFLNVSAEWEHVIYILGNHEYYGSYIEHTESILRDYLKPFPNIYILNNSSLDIGEFCFVGGTLWTNLNNNNPLTSIYLLSSKILNDFKMIRIGSGPGRKLLPSDTYQYHIKTMEVIEQSEHNKVIVVTHHAPSFRSISPEYSHLYHLNGGFASDLDNFILKHNNIKIWIHGHIHHESDYNIGDTRIICNPRGHEFQSKKFKLKTIDI